MTERPLKPNRRWFQYSLRSLLVFMMVASIGCGWLANKARQERAAIARVNWVCGSVGYASDSPSWWRKLFRFPWRVREIVLSYREVSDLSLLDGLTNLEVLRLEHTKVSNVATLAGQTNLQVLQLGDTRVNDISPLAGLTNLQVLNLHGTPLQNLSPLAGLTNLRTLYLTDTKVSDLSPLTGLKNLTHLAVTNTSVSDEQLQKIRKALPKCRIVR